MKSGMSRILLLSLDDAANRIKRLEGSSFENFISLTVILLEEMKL